MNTGPAGVVGVVGAGTMGAGIAQLAAQSGARTLISDPDAAALERGLEGVRAALERGAQRGRWDPAAAAAASGRLEAVDQLGALAACELVIEAAPERLALKQQLLGDLEAIVNPDCVLATNTSSLPVAALAGASALPGRVVGMHFFNPAPVMRLVELVAHDDADPAAVARVRATAEAMGRTVIDAADGPGFLVNRCNRPFGLEAQRLVAERRATPEQIDRICRLAGFRMGPFELADLVGLDVGLEVSRSFWEQSFGEPRWRPSPLVARLVAAGRLGRKSGRGWYGYDEGTVRAPDPEPPAAGGGAQRLLILTGGGRLAGALAAESRQAGWAVSDAGPEDATPWLVVDCDAPGTGRRDHETPRARLLVAGSLAALESDGAAAGFFALPHTPVAEVCGATGTGALAMARTTEWLRSLGRHVEEVSDAPGLVLGRIVAQLANEGWFALGEGVGSAADIDSGLCLGMNHPVGPLQRADTLGLDSVVALLDALRQELGEAYRAAPELSRAASATSAVA